MLVEMKIQLSGTRDGVEWPAVGATIDVPDDEAAALIQHGSAIKSAPVEKAKK